MTAKLEPEDWKFIQRQKAIHTEMTAKVLRIIFHWISSWSETELFVCGENIIVMAIEPCVMQEKFAAHFDCMFADCLFSARLPSTLRLYY